MFYVDINTRVHLLTLFFLFLGILVVGMLIGVGIALYIGTKLVMKLVNELKQTLKSAMKPESISETFKKFGLEGGSFRLPIH